MNKLDKAIKELDITSEGTASTDKISDNAAENSSKEENLNSKTNQ